MKTAYKEPHDFLSQHKLAILSTSDGQDDVWGAAIYYAIDESLTFYFFTKTGSKKYQHILENPHVAVTVADDETQTTVQAAGQVEEVPMEKRDEIYHKLVLVHPSGDFSWKPPVSKLNDDGQTVVLKLRPTLLQFAEFKSDSHLTGDHIRRII